MNLEDLPALASDKKSGVVLKKKIIHVALMPEQQQDIEGSILKNFDSHKNKFHPDLRGVLMDYDGVQVRSRDLKDLPRWPFLHLPIEADFLLFHPKKGLRLICRVTKKGVNFMECLFLGTFRLSVSKPAGVEDWMETGVDLGQAVEVEVISVATLNDYTVMEGRLVEEVKKKKEVTHVEEFNGNICEDVDSGMESNCGKRKMEPEEEEKQARKRKKMEKRMSRENKIISRDTFKEILESKSLDGVVATDDGKNKFESDLKKQKKEEKRKRKEEKKALVQKDILLKQEETLVLEMMKKAEKKKEKLYAKSEVLLPPDPEQLEEKAEKVIENDEMEEDNLSSSESQEKEPKEAGKPAETLNTPEKEKSNEEKNSQETVKHEGVTHESNAPKDVCDSSKKIGENKTEDEEVEYSEEASNQEASDEDTIHEDNEDTKYEDNEDTKYEDNEDTFYKDNEDTLLEDDRNSGYESDASRTTTIDGYEFVASRTSSRIGSRSPSRSSSSSEEEEEESSSQKSEDEKLKGVALIKGCRTALNTPNKAKQEETRSSSSSEEEQEESQSLLEDPKSIAIKEKSNLKPPTSPERLATSSSTLNDVEKEKITSSSTEKEKNTSSATCKDDDGKEKVTSSSTGKLEEKDIKQILQPTLLQKMIQIKKEKGEKIESQKPSLANNFLFPESWTVTSNGRTGTKIEYKFKSPDGKVFRGLKKAQEHEAIIKSTQDAKVAKSTNFEEIEKVNSSSTLKLINEKEKVTSNSSTKDKTINKEKPCLSNNFFLPKSWSVTSNGRTGKSHKYKYIGPDGKKFTSAKQAQEHEAKIESAQVKDFSLDAKAIDNQDNVSKLVNLTNSEDDSLIKSQSPNKNLSSQSPKLPKDSNRSRISKDKSPKKNLSSWSSKLPEVSIRSIRQDHETEVTSPRNPTNSGDDSLVKSQSPKKNYSSQSTKLPEDSNGSIRQDHETEVTSPSKENKSPQFSSTVFPTPMTTKPAKSNFEKKLFGKSVEEKGAPLDGISPILKPGSKTAASPNLDGSVLNSLQRAKSKKHRRNKSEPGFQ